MRNYIIRRVLLMIPTLFLVTIAVFAIVRLIPGTVIDLMVQEMEVQSGLFENLTPEYLLKSLGLDEPLHVQYGKWLVNAVQGDLGRSLWTNRPIAGDLLRRYPVSGEIGIIALVTAVTIALPIGTYSAIRQDTYGDYIGRTIAILAISLPSFWVGTMVVVYPSIYLNWSPPIHYIPLVEDPLGNLAQFIIPGLILGMLMSGTTMRMTRTMMLEVLRQDYIRTAWAKGLTEWTVIVRHALKNALIPVVTIIGVLVPLIVSGEVVLEQIFALPGIGLFLIEAVTKRDYPIISAINVVVATTILFVNLTIDLTYAWLDPRVQYE